jgi:NAD+ synthetase
MNYKKAVENIRSILKTYVQNAQLQSLIIGQSGGIDSALCTVLAKPVCDELGIELISRSITIVTNKPEEYERANAIGKYFAHNHKYIDLSDAFYALEKMVMEDFENEDHTSFNYRLRLGNVKARTRMIYLYELASKYKGMVLSTDNYTELMLGFWTLHGDVGDYGMIQNLWKMEVYEMAKYLASEMENSQAADALIACVSATPTDGLGITNSDLDQIGVSTYAEVDAILKQILRGEIAGLENNKVYQRHINSQFKRNNPYNIPREQILAD